MIWWPTIDDALRITHLDDFLKGARNSFYGGFLFFHGSGSSIAFTFGLSSDIALVTLKFDQVCTHFL